MWHSREAHFLDSQLHIITNRVFSTAFFISSSMLKNIMGTFRPASVQVSDALLSFMAQVQWQSQTLTCFFRMKCTFEWHPAGGTCCISCKAGCSLPRNSGKGVRDAQSLPAVSCTWGKEATGEPERGGWSKVDAGEWGVRHGFLTPALWGNHCLHTHF